MAAFFGKSENSKKIFHVFGARFFEMAEFAEFAVRVLAASASECRLESFQRGRERLQWQSAACSCIQLVVFQQKKQKISLLCMPRYRQPTEWSPPTKVQMLWNCFTQYMPLPMAVDTKHCRIYSVDAYSVDA